MKHEINAVVKSAKSARGMIHIAGLLFLSMCSVSSPDGRCRHALLSIEQHITSRLIAPVLIGAIGGEIPPRI
jgi:hypothetical protein